MSKIIFFLIVLSITIVCAITEKILSHLSSKYETIEVFAMATKMGIALSALTLLAQLKYIL